MAAVCTGGGPLRQPQHFSPRPYQPAFDHAAACRIPIGGDEGTLPQHFSPQVLKMFREVADRFEETYGKWR